MMPRSKYNARPATVDGTRFDSQAEAARYVELRLLLRAGKIDRLELQPVFELVKKFTTHTGEKIRAISYFADFQYVDLATGKTIVEDVKGMKTEVYKIKKKLLLWRYPEINFIEI